MACPFNGTPFNAIWTISLPQKDHHIQSPLLLLHLQLLVASEPGSGSWVVSSDPFTSKVLVEVIVDGFNVNHHVTSLSSFTKSRIQMVDLISKAHLEN